MTHQHIFVGHKDDGTCAFAVCSDDETEPMCPEPSEYKVTLREAFCSHCGERKFAFLCERHTHLLLERAAREVRSVLPKDYEEDRPLEVPAEWSNG